MNREKRESSGKGGAREREIEGVRRREEDIWSESVAVGGELSGK